MDEEWKATKEFPDYAVSNYGRIKRITDGKNTYIGRILKLSANMRGYPIITFRQQNGKHKTVTVHKLVTEVFLGPCPKGYERNHIDGNKKNNYYKNLEYVTSSENNKYAFRLGLMNQKGENHARSKLNKKDVLKIRELYATGKYLQKEIAKIFNVAQTTINSIITYRRWKHVR